MMLFRRRTCILLLVVCCSTDIDADNRNSDRSNTNLEDQGSNNNNINNDNTSCEVDGSCPATTTIKKVSRRQQQQDSSICNDIQPQELCISHTNIYKNGGGTAMAYVPDQPISTYICDPNNGLSNNINYRQAKSPFWRSNWGSNKAPQIQLKINLLGCSNNNNNSNNYEKTSCCCQPLTNNNNINSTQLEVWQAFPDGTYPSIKNDIGVCRTNTGSSTTISSFVLETIAPGSVGSLNGLGPSKWDFIPYWPPVIHILAKASGYTSTLINVPIVIDMNTLEQTTFWGGDWRGSGWVVQKDNKGNNKRYRIVSWDGNLDKNRIEIEIDVFLTQRQIDQQQQEEDEAMMCPSLVYGLPTSFFVEPISICAPSILDFFDM